MLNDAQLLDDDPQRKPNQHALLNQLLPGGTAVRAPDPGAPGFSGGFFGGEPGIVGPPTEQPVPVPGAPPAASAAPDYTKLGQFAGGLGGYDMAKFDRPADQWSEKYKIGAVQSHFDPTQGITPEFLSALNGLGIGDFSGSGDKLNVANGRNGARFGAGGTSDVVQGLKGGNGRWTYWEDPALAQQQAPQPQPMGGGMPMPGLNPMLSGDPSSRIQHALSGFTQRSPNIEALLAQLQQGT